MIHKREWVRFLLLPVVILLVSCSGNDYPGTGEEERALLQPVDGGSLSIAESRSSVNGASVAASADKINKIRIYLSNPDNSRYKGIASGGEVFTLQSDGKTWKSTVPVYVSIKQNVYACAPSGLVVTHSDAGKHTVPVSLSASQTFDGGNAWNCSNTDYLYGSASNTVGQAVQIVADRDHLSPAICLQHAFVQVVFTMENASGRVPDAEYDYVKSIRLKANSGNPFPAGSGTMQLSNGTVTFGTPVSELTFSPSANAVKVGDTGIPSIVAYGLVAPRTAYTGTMTLTLVLGKVGNTSTERELSVSSALFNAKWEKGCKYVYSLSLGDRNVVISSAAIKAWDAVTNTSELLPDRN